MTSRPDGTGSSLYDGAGIKTGDVLIFPDISSVTPKRAPLDSASRDAHPEIRPQFLLRKIRLLST
jgi:hypothetical protein